MLHFLQKLCRFLIFSLWVNSTCQKPCLTLFPRHCSPICSTSFICGLHISLGLFVVKFCHNDKSKSKMYRISLKLNRVFFSAMNWTKCLLLFTTLLSLKKRKSIKTLFMSFYPIFYLRILSKTLSVIYMPSDT